LERRGFSPRVQGAACYLAQPCHYNGIFPACAGSSNESPGKESWSMNHPCVCGEQAVLSRLNRKAIGSPPRVRGAAWWWWPWWWWSGITPACAGSRQECGAKHLTGWDHPRVCGEQGCPPGCCPPSLGSPPRVRGAVHSKEILPYTARITPACAGSSYYHATERNRRRDHPRVCGEQYQTPRPLFVAAGSPPRVRGAASAARRDIHGLRITPACAGSRSYDTSQV